MAVIVTVCPLVSIGSAKALVEAALLVLGLCFDVGDRTSHQYRILATTVFYTDSIGILPAHRTRQAIARCQLNFDVLFIADNRLHLANAGQLGIKGSSAHRNGGEWWKKQVPL